jgi:kynureninase
MDETSEAYARELDTQEQGRTLRGEFIIPSKADLRRKSIKKNGIYKAPRRSNSKLTPVEPTSGDEPSIYLCGNSLGLQPKRTADYIQKTLETWAMKGVHGHFTELDDAVVPPWLSIHEPCQAPLARIVGALPHEVTAMQTLTANLHLLMATFYRPTKQRHKIILEAKAFPSDHVRATSWTTDTFRKANRNCSSLSSLKSLIMG